MKERPILFSAPMVRALMREKNPKTQTRRIVKVTNYVLRTSGNPNPSPSSGRLVIRDGEAWDDNPTRTRPIAICPYGKPGDRLWVRETWMESHTGEAVNGRGQLLYRASWGNVPESQRWRPSLHMPRWASRLTLEVTGIRVERLQDITANDILAEGVVDPQMTIIAGVGVHHPDRLRAEWIKLWDSINADRAPWDSNPWVWVVEFRRLDNAPRREAPPDHREGVPPSHPLPTRNTEVTP